MKKVVRTDDWAESGLFESEDDYKDYIANVQKKLAWIQKELFERIQNCPKKKRTPVFYEDIPEANQDKKLPQNTLPMTQDHSPDHDVKRAIKNEYITTKKNTTPDHKNHNNGDNNHKSHDPVKKLSKPPRRPDKEDHHQCKEKRQRKKAAMDQGPDMPPAMPRWLRDVVEEKGGHGERLLIQKGLTPSDVLVGQNRISMPVRQLRSPDDFLTEEELRNVLSRKDDDEKHFKGLNVTFVEPYSKTSMLSLRKWDYGSSSSYVFASKELKDFIKRNGLKAGDIIQIWFFRCNDGSPCFALVNLTIETASSSTNSSSMLSLQIKKIT